MYDIKITRADVLKEKPQDESQLGFGRIFTDHMLLIEFHEGVGWHDARVVPLQNLSLHPASSVLHYSQEIFEGAKCYRTETGMNLFRIRDNFERMNRSAARMGMATMPVDLYLESLMALLSVDKEWTPHQDGTSLYIRPTMIATKEYLGVSASDSYLYFVLLSPSGAYYASGLAPVGIYVEDEHVRAVRGGVGVAKTGGNYSASILAGIKAKKLGYAQVLWLDGVEQRYVEEVGAMNMMFVYDNKKVVTPVLNGSILPGITRDSTLKLAKYLGYETEEKPVHIDEVIRGVKSGKITEAFGTGTAAVISPVNKIFFKGEEVFIGDNTIGPIARILYDTLTGIQYGRVADPFHWIMPVK